MLKKYVELTEENFGKVVLSNQKPVLVDFWATWCPPCKALAPTIDELADEMEETVIVAKLDIDAVPSIAEQYGIMSVPTLLLFKNGNVVDKMMGAKPKSKIEDMINDNL